MSDTSLTTLASAEGFKEILRDKILATFMGLIPAEKLDSLVDNEVNAFFACEDLLIVKETNIEVDNPKYDNSRGYGYGNDRKLNRSTLAFGSKMTPFRQLVWTELFKHVQPLISTIISNEESSVRKQIDTWLLDTVVDGIRSAHVVNFNTLAASMGTTMFSRTLTTANMNAASMLQSALVGLAEPNAVQEALKRASQAPTFSTMV